MHPFTGIYPEYLRLDPRNMTKAADWEESVRQLLKEGQLFFAYDIAKTGLEQFPDNTALKRYCARVLIHTGALDDAKNLLESILPQYRPDDLTLSRFYTVLKQVVKDTNRSESVTPSEETMSALAQMLRELKLISGSQWSEQNADEEALGLLGRVHKDLWKRSGRVEDARLARDTYHRSFVATGGYWTGINAATMSWLIGEFDIAAQLARQVLQICQNTRERATGEDLCWTLATMGEAYLLLDDAEAARDSYAEAVRLVGKNYAMLISAQEQLRLMAQHGFPVPEAVFQCFKSPAVVVFAGHRLDSPEQMPPRFPPSLENAVRAALDERLALMDAQVGYCSASCGSDILFIEAMLDRDAEVNILLPCGLEDFVAHCVAPADAAYPGSRWASRLQRALRLVNSVKYITQEPLFEDQALFDFLARMLQGYAAQRARMLLTKPTPLVLWNDCAAGTTGGTANFLSHWPEPEELQVIALGEILAKTPVPAKTETPASRYVSPPPTHQTDRTIKTMLFADIVGYSKLDEHNVPSFMYRFLQKIADQCAPPPYINTWGDAIFAVMDEAAPLLTYALQLQEVICDSDWSEIGLPDEMNIRIALHTGPVFSAVDPLTARLNYYGAHVNRVARMEPVTIPGEIYASEQFVGLLTYEQTVAEVQARREGRVWVPPVVCSYLGPVSLAKNFGSQVTYHVRRNMSGERQPTDAGQ